MNMKTTYIAYLRQSIQKQEISGLGIEAQREIIQNYLKEKKPVSEYIETESGKKSDRHKLTEALEECRKNGSILFIAKLDRLSRNVWGTKRNVYIGGEPKTSEWTMDKAFGAVLLKKAS